MPEKNAAERSLILEGEWVMDQAAELLKFLAGELAQLLEAAPGLSGAEIDMSGVEDVDACGCQLLAVFMENLRRLGIAPVPCGITGPVTEKIRLLGFRDAFAAPEPGGEESA